MGKRDEFNAAVDQRGRKIGASRAQVRQVKQAGNEMFSVSEGIAEEARLTAELVARARKR